MAGGGIQSLVSVVLFLAGGFRLDLAGFTLLMLFLWSGHLLLFFVIRLGINQRLADLSMTRELVMWSILTLLFTIFFMERFRSLMMMFFPIILIYGTFRMIPKQYMATAALMILGYLFVMVGIHKTHPPTLTLGDEWVTGIVFVLVIVASSFVSNEISLFRKKLHQRNAELATAMEKNKS